MSRILDLFRPALRMWQRFNDVLYARAQREVNAWGSSLQYKRRYTNPDSAKAARQPS